MKQRVLLGLFLIFLLALPGLATNYYVSQVDGNDSYNGLYPTFQGGSNGPWLTIGKADDLTGDQSDNIVLFCRGGNWAEQYTIACYGTLGHPFLIGAYGTGANPIISGGSVRPNCITASSKNYITIQDIQCTGWLARGIYFTESNGIIIQRCAISGGNNSAPDHAIQLQRTSGALKTGVQLLDNTIGQVATSNQTAVGFSGITLQGMKDAIISGNVINTTYCIGLQIIKDAAGDNDDNLGCLIEHNIIYGCYNGGIFNSNSDGSVIRYNHVYSLSGMGIGTSYDSDNVLICYNLIHDLGKGGTTWNGIDVNHDSQAGKVYNNTIYKVYGNCFVIDDLTAACNGWEIKNNILDASQNGGEASIPGLCWRLNGAAITYTSNFNLCYPKNQLLGGVQDPTHYDSDNTTYYTLAGWQTAMSQELNSKSADPLMADPVNGDFTLQAASPCINAGTDVGMTQQDYAGNQVPSGAWRDLGAYEYLAEWIIRGSLQNIMVMIFPNIILK